MDEIHYKDPENGRQRTETDGSNYQYTIPTKADFLFISHNTTKSTQKYHKKLVINFFFSENNAGVSPFVRILCERLVADSKEKHLLEILTFISQQMFLNSGGDYGAKYHELPFWLSSLTRLIHFGDPKT